MVKNIDAWRTFRKMFMRLFALVQFCPRANSNGAFLNKTKYAILITQKIYFVNSKTSSVSYEYIKCGVWRQNKNPANAYVSSVCGVFIFWLYFIFNGEIGRDWVVLDVP